ncbi:UNVERIFIED_CONTAM: putative protein ycf45 [Sesamum calycinum]|uniref:Uncharacterized protein n=1 Tax=Sesamum calycinum TaxID=2727403 RepID=A0AAW2P969_9LAMI
MKLEVMDGGARRLQVPDPCMKHKVMIEAVDNHMPEVIIVDEIGTEAEVLAILLHREESCLLVGGLKTVILSDEAARTRNCKKIILERRSAPAFPFLIEMRERDYWVAHRTDKSVDELLQGKKPLVEVRRIDKQFKVVIERWQVEE